MAKRLFIEFPELKQLDKFSKKVAQRIFNTHRDWLLHSKVQDYKEDRFLEIHLHSPIRPTERDLIISTQDGRITVHFDWYHAHFAMYENIDFDDMFQSAMQFVNAIFHEEVIVGIQMIDRQLSSAVALTPQTSQRDLPFQVTYIRSWLGTYDENPAVN
jgi:hypothetical protein